MLVFGTQMSVVTFIFVCVEVALLFYLAIYRLSRPDDKNGSYNIGLVFLLLIYNITGGLLPDPNLPGSLFVQETIAYATGFIAPSYFPFYVYKAFNLTKMKFHAYTGVTICLLFPFAIFVAIYAKTADLDKANSILVIPVVYAGWVIVSLLKALKYKYGSDFSTYVAKEERIGLLISLTPWVALPVIIIFKINQGIEATVTNTGFLLLLGLQLKNHISQFRREHDRLIKSEVALTDWNILLQQEVEKRTHELELLNQQKEITFVNLAHETKTPLTLIKNYLDDFSPRHRNAVEYQIVKRSINKLAVDINNLLDLEKFSKGFSVYDNEQISCITDIVRENVTLFEAYSKKKGIQLNKKIESNLFIKADPMAINRLINNLVENAIKYTLSGGKIEVELKKLNNQIQLTVKDTGEGIPSSLQEKIFEPYFQITERKKKNQGLGLGLPIVKQIISSLGGSISVNSNPGIQRGTEILIQLQNYEIRKEDEPSAINVEYQPKEEQEIQNLRTLVHDKVKRTILIVEDNQAMAHFLKLKLSQRYNFQYAENGAEAIKQLKENKILPDLIISDIMMDEVDGFKFAEYLSLETELNHIPLIFLSAISSIEERIQGLNLGAIDFIGKPFSFPELSKKVDSILRNASNHRQVFLRSVYGAISKLNMERDISTSLLAGGNFEKNCNLYGLSSREKTIAHLIQSGVDYKTIADSLYISERTVTTHVTNIFEKVHVTNKIQLINKLIA